MVALSSSSILTCFRGTAVNRVTARRIVRISAPMPKRIENTSEEKQFQSCRAQGLLPDGSDKGQLLMHFLEFVGKLYVNHENQYVAVVAGASGKWLGFMMSTPLVAQLGKQFIFVMATCIYLLQSPQ